MLRSNDAFAKINRAVFCVHSHIGTKMFGATKIFGIAAQFFPNWAMQF